MVLLVVAYARKTTEGDDFGAACLREACGSDLMFAMNISRRHTVLPAALQAREASVRGNNNRNRNNANPWRTCA